MAGQQKQTANQTSRSHSLNHTAGCQRDCHVALVRELAVTAPAAGSKTSHLYALHCCSGQVKNAATFASIYRVNSSVRVIQLQIKAACNTSVGWLLVFCLFLFFLFLFSDPGVLEESILKNLICALSVCPSSHRAAHSLLGWNFKTQVL